MLDQRLNQIIEVMNDTFGEYHYLVELLLDTTTLVIGLDERLKVVEDMLKFVATKVAIQNDNINLMK